MGLTSESVLGVVTSVPPEALLLDLSSNAVERLTSGVFDSVPNLEYLFLAHNQVRSLGLSVFQYQHRLQELSLKGNRLKEVGGGVFVNMSTLRILNLDGNEIEQIHTNAFSLPHLRQLHLQKNHLTRLASFHLSGLPALQVLDLTDNNIQTIEVGAFQDLSSLQVLRLSRNRLSSLAENVFQGLTSLRELYLDGNLLPSLDCFEVPHFASTLQTLVLSNNSLVAVPRDVFSKLSRLSVLTLDHNRISFVGIGAFKNLQLDNLTLAHNVLEEINREMLEGCKRISKLDLSHNRINAMKTGALDSFRESVYVLNLAGNGLASLDHGMLRGMRNLQTLNLSSNGLRTILEGSFQELAQLVDLDLDSNKLQWLSAELLKGPSLQRLSVLDNPLQHLTGFTFEGALQRVEVWVNLTQQSSTTRSVTVTWPFRQGAQLYWTLRLWCLPQNDTDRACQAPVVQSSVSPNKVRETVGGLEPGRGYFVCVDPNFLSTLIHVQQCGRVFTQHHPRTTVKPQDHRSPLSSRGVSLRAHSAGVVWTCVVVVSVLGYSQVWSVVACCSQLWCVVACCSQLWSVVVCCSEMCQRTLWSLLLSCWTGGVPLLDSRSAGVAVR
ncbi:hypothetical protein ACOMHN_000682 [Nucella lapillus]